MLVMGIGDEMCWWEQHDVGDGFSHFGHQQYLFTQASAINIQKMSPTSNSVTNVHIFTILSHQHYDVTYITFTREFLKIKLGVIQ